MEVPDVKRIVIACGGTGAKAAEAIVYAACAGALTGPLSLLLVDTDATDAAGRRVEALLADYAQAQPLFAPLDGQAFHPAVDWRRWPEADAPARASAWLRGDEALRKALCELPPSEMTGEGGFHGRVDAAALCYMGWLNDALRRESALRALLEEAESTLSSGEGARFVLIAGETGGTGKAAAALLARLLRQRFGGRASVAAITLGPYFGAPTPPVSSPLLPLPDLSEQCGAVYRLGLPEGNRDADVAESARLCEWLAVKCMEDAFRREGNAPARRTVGASGGAFSWADFGEAGDALRLTYGRLLKCASLMRLALSPALEQYLSQPNFLRDRVNGWYAGIFAKARKGSPAEREALLEQLRTIMRLLDGYSLWVRQITDTMPPQMRYAAHIAALRRAAEHNYLMVVELAGQLREMEYAARVSGMAEEKIVHRYSMEDSEAEKLMKRIEAARDKLSGLREQQAALNQRLGGAGTLEMLEHFERICADQLTDLRRQVAEAKARIDRAATDVSAQEQYKVVAARTRLANVERHVATLEGRLACVREDRLRAGQERVIRPPEPAGADAQPESGLFPPASLARLADALTQSAGQKQLKPRLALAETVWAGLVAPEGRDTVAVREALEGLAQCAAPEEGLSPVACLVGHLITLSMKEDA